MMQIAVLVLYCGKRRLNDIQDKSFQFNVASAVAVKKLVSAAGFDPLRQQTASKY